MSHQDQVFSGDVAERYQELLVPLIFEDAAADVADRVAEDIAPSAALLEIAAGTGVVTRALANRLPPTVAITATDLNQAMLDKAVAIGTGDRAVTWQQADVMALPFDDGTFDVAVCEFGAMFFPDRPAAFAEVRRVLKPNGRFLCTVWDRIEANEIAETVEDAAAEHLHLTPPLFLRRKPYVYFDEAALEADIRAGGFAGSVEIEPVEGTSVAPSAYRAAAAFSEGTVLRDEIEAAVGPEGLAAVTERATAAVEARFGADGPVSARIRWLVIDARAD